MITFTVDVETPGPIGGSTRHVETTRRLLSLLGEHDARGTFFVVAGLLRTGVRGAQEGRALVAEIASAGHEVALHSMTHTPLPQLGVDAFRDETRDAKRLLEDAAGTAVLGYRAPIFSLTRESLWAPEILRELGFEYSSSVLPARSPLFGFPGAPREVFRWPSGLLEIPAPVARVGPLVVPFLGGIYFRYLTFAMLRRRFRALAPGSLAWSYGHPYDFDPDESLASMENAAWWVRLALARRRRGALDRLARWIREIGPLAPPLVERLTACEDAPRFDA